MMNRNTIQNKQEHKDKRKEAHNRVDKKKKKTVVFKSKLEQM